MILIKGIHLYSHSSPIIFGEMYKQGCQRKIRKHFSWNVILGPLLKNKHSTDTISFDLTLTGAGFFGS